MTNQKQKQPQRGPAPAANPGNVQECDPTKTDGSPGATGKPSCPEGYPDEQPKTPADKKPKP